MKLIWSRRAKTDVQLLRAFIAQDSQFYARQFIERLLGRIDNLQDHPQQGRLVPEAGRADTREIIFRSYRIIYRTAPDHLLIITVVHGSRNLAGQKNQLWEEDS